MLIMKKELLTCHKEADDAHCESNQHDDGKLGERRIKNDFEEVVGNYQYLKKIHLQQLKTDQVSSPP